MTNEQTAQNLENKFTAKMPKINLIPLENIAINIKTQKDWNALMIGYQAGNWKWMYSNPPTSINCWPEYKEKTCIDGKFMFVCVPDEEFYAKRGCDIISVDKFFEMQKITNKKLNEIKAWFEKYKSNRKSRG